ncbi:anhydro-N-acetylmuramic acid kinase [Lacibacterium aquatile]|uniref:Anhydro-N-acetylmuramic acid kinase n=1 Tax=Lacibacterium aquatile TaxID=1168082 RepID=A0ABW5DQV3_9PROT
MTARRFRALGLISGTSMDGIDAAIIDTDGSRVFGFHGALTHPYPDAVRTELLAVARDPAKAELPLAELEAAVTKANAEAVNALLAASGIALHTIDVVGMHGQTILHRPERRFTRQLGQGDVLSRMLGRDVVAGFRLADVAAGGQGAPFAPLYHAALAADLGRPLAVLNLGGVGNVTYLGTDLITAFDTGPASAMIDDWVGKHLGLAYDADGATAAKGNVNDAALAKLMDNPYFAAPAPKSLDRNDFPITPVEGLGVEDGAATLTCFTAKSVAASLPHLPGAPTRWLVTGGGRLNSTMMRMLREELGVPVDPVEAVGWRGDSLEAECFGFLAVRSLLGQPLSVPTTTGVPQPMTGGVLFRAKDAA